MSKKKKQPEVEKPKLHPHNKHIERYDLQALAITNPALSSFVQLNIHGNETIDFTKPEAVKALNKALLQYHYNITFWDIPEHYLCPPIPGRADYIHHMADLLQVHNYGTIPTGTEKITCLDIGVGANCVYPIIGINEYNWSFIGVDIDSVAVESAKEIVNQNAVLKGKVDIRLQPNPKDTFYGAITKDEIVDITICNPPFHASLEEATKGTVRKVWNLSGDKSVKPILNFGGQNTELWCEGGEKRFIRDMIRERKKFGEHCFWFSTLVSKQSNLKGIYETLKAVEAVAIETIPMGQGNKSSRIVAWTFLTKEQQKAWKDMRWNKKKK